MCKKRAVNRSRKQRGLKNKQSEIRPKHDITHLKVETLQKQLVKLKDTVELNMLCTADIGVLLRA
jgi:hypothetical protein